MRIIQLIIITLILGIIPLKAQKLGYINDSDGYTNLRIEPFENSNIISIITNGQEFRFYPNPNNDWWRVDYNFRTGYMHKSRIKDYNKVKVEISRFLKDFYLSDRDNAELSEGNNEKLFFLIQDYPLASLTAFCEQPQNIQSFLIAELESPIHDLIDLQLIYSRLISLKSPTSKLNKITDALKIAANNLGMNLITSLVFDYNIPDYNRPDKHPTISNKYFPSQLEGHLITFYLNHPKINTYAKMFYQGQFAVSDDTLTFGFLDSLLTSNIETKAFYLHVFNSVLEVADGALSESIGSECRAYLEKFPCDFIKIKNSILYAHNYQKWIDYAAYEYYFEEKPILTINESIDSIKSNIPSLCANQTEELENIRTKLIEYINNNK
ncbi:SH3 domain-containing protein [Plebeiibacterium sediminum]|uniref:SH3 domain-containing protein n=1 Tax=Plebeiibacterium sediminum TaxID=2992112 RepID=A0AAE3M2C7_9BACT|nr:SH3 domain-containing protein [Plebeiobacterium sediminum]MCW3785849.1 SH3 domain-containing protein [Plebeiobacterium sediminum]